MASKEGQTVIAKEGQTTTNLQLHPVVIIHISDHWTRAKVQQEIVHPRVVGAILGIQNGRNIEIMNTFELEFSQEKGLDAVYLHKKVEQFRKVFPTHDFLGWYSTGSSVQPSDIEIHKQIMEMNESPIYLLFDTSACANPATRELPLSIYESELHIVNEQPTLLFVKVPYKIETGEAERMAVDHVAKTVTEVNSSGSLLSAHLIGVYNAIAMLNERIRILVKFLEATKKGSVPIEYGLLRRMASLSSQLPAIDTAPFKQEFIHEYNDALLTTYLATITKGTNASNDLIDKFNVSYDRQSRRKGLF